VNSKEILTDFFMAVRLMDDRVVVEQVIVLETYKLYPCEYNSMHRQRLYLSYFVNTNRIQITKFKRVVSEIFNFVFLG